MHLCPNCQHRTNVTEAGGRRCAVNAPASRLLEAGQSVGRCEQFVRIGDGKRLLVDRAGRIPPPAGD